MTGEVRGGVEPSGEDIGTIAEVPEDDRLDVDEGEGVNALEGGDDSEAAEAAFRNPGQVKILGGDS
jgi:hypothetical protein